MMRVSEARRELRWTTAGVLASLMVFGCRDAASGLGGSSATGIDSIGASSEGADETAADVLYLELDPPESVLELNLGESTTVPYTVNAVRSDGSRADVTATATFEVFGASVGVMNGSTLEVAGHDEIVFASAIVSATVGDLTGQAQVTLASYDLENDFFFVLPFEDPQGEQTKPLTFSTEIKSLDVFVNMDTTSSMDGALLNLQGAMADSIIPSIQAQVPDTQFGGGTFQDFPLRGYGIPNLDQPFELYQSITDDTMAVQDAVLDFKIGDGGDPPESHFEALYQIATGEGLTGPPPTEVQAHNDGVGGVGFRDESFPIIVSITNQGSHDLDVTPGTCSAYAGSVRDAAHSREQVFAALKQVCARVVQIAVEDPPDGDLPKCNALTDGIALAEGTGASIPPEAWDIDGRPAGCNAGECCTGSDAGGVPPNAEGLCPMAFQTRANGTGVDTSLSRAIRLLAAYGRFGVTRQISGVTTDINDVPLPAGVTTADFITGVTPSGHGPLPLPGASAPILREEEFENVIPDTDVVFDVRAINQIVPQTAEPQVFVASIAVFADDCGQLDARDVYVLVPPEELVPAG